MHREIIHQKERRGPDFLIRDFMKNKGSGTRTIIAFLASTNYSAKRRQTLQEFCKKLAGLSALSKMHAIHGDL
jgi:hypothetical protein